MNPPGHTDSFEYEPPITPERIESTASSPDHHDNALVTRQVEAESKPKRRKWFMVAGLALIVVVLAAVGLTVGLVLGNKDDNGGSNVLESPAPTPSPSLSFRPTISGSEWLQLGQDLDGLAAFNEYSQKISLSGDGSTLAIDSTQFGDRIAYVQMFRLETGQWTLVGDTLFQESASTVALSFDGSRIVIGTTYQEDQASLSGQVQVYEWNSSS